MKPQIVHFLRNFDIECNQVLCIESDVNYSQVHLLTGKKVTIAKTLKQVSDIVKEHAFVRVNRQMIINISHVCKYENEFFPIKVILSNGRTIQFSRRRSDIAKNQIDQYILNRPI